MASTMQGVQIVFGVPEGHLSKVLDAMAAAGAGVIGEYTHCSFSNAGVGRFKPSAAANPALGERGQINEEAEVRVETFCSYAQAKAIVQAIRAAHPYEEPVIYAIPLLDVDTM
jgi:hypothetical protein